MTTNCLKNIVQKLLKSKRFLQKKTVRMYGEVD